MTAGAVCRVDMVSLDAEHTARMAGLGVSVGQTIRLVRASEPVVVQVYGARIGIARSIARSIQVTPNPSPGTEIA
jgi:Fe2+ transport system protein FeoA